MVRGYDVMETFRTNTPVFDRLAIVLDILAQIAPRDPLVREGNIILATLRNDLFDRYGEDLDYDDLEADAEVLYDRIGDRINELLPDWLYFGVPADMPGYAGVWVDWHSDEVVALMHAGASKVEILHAAMDAPVSTNARLVLDGA